MNDGTGRHIVLSFCTRGRDDNRMTARRRPRPSRYDVLTELENQLTLATWLEHHLDDWQGPRATTGERGPTGSHSDPTAATALGQSTTKADDNKPDNWI